MRLTLELKPHVVENLDRIVRADMNKEPDDWTRSAVLVNLMLDRARQLHEGAQREGGDGDAAPGPGDHAADNANAQGNAIRTIARLRQSRDRYRDLAARAEAALLGAPVRDDFGGIERRLEGALQDKGFEMPAASDPRRSADRRRAGNRRGGGR